MARVRYLEKSEIGPEAVPVYEMLEESIGKVLHPVMTVAHSPKLLRDWWTMMMTLINDLKLDAHLRELALLRIFTLTGCDYCFAEHDRIALQAGCTEDQVKHIDEYDEHTAFNELERLVLQYTDQITLENDVSDELYGELSKHLSEQEMVELTFCIGNWNGISRFIVPMGLELDSPKRT